MRKLKFTVEGQRLRKDPKCDFSGLIPGSRHYLEAAFTFDSEWDECVCVAEFRDDSNDIDAALVEDGACEIPASVLNEHNFYVRLIGKRADGYCITTNQLQISQGG